MRKSFFFFWGKLRKVIGKQNSEDDNTKTGNHDHRQMKETSYGTYHGHFRDFLDFMTLWHDQRRDSGGGNSGAHGKTLLVSVQPVMPSAPRLCGSEHSSTSAHVTVCRLARSVSTATTDTGNTGNGAACTPRSSRGLVASFAANLYEKRREDDEAAI